MRISGQLKFTIETINHQYEKVFFKTIGIICSFFGVKIDINFHSIGLFKFEDFVNFSQFYSE